MSPPPTNHPPPEHLRALRLGLLTEEEQDQVAVHLEVCSGCCDVLEHQDAPILVRLRHGGGVAWEGGEEPAADAARVTPADLSGGETVGAAPLARPRGEKPETDLTTLFQAAQTPDEIGRLGPYRIVKLLGRGGMGAVFVAEDSRLRRTVALKVMLPAIACQADARERFLREARMAAAIEHDHIVSIYQIDEDHGVPFIAMPLLKGATLEDRLSPDSPLSVPQILKIGREVAKGLAAAHERGLLHRDVKPGNIWLEEREAESQVPSQPSPDCGADFRVKLLDFGLARPSAGGDVISHPGLVVGTPAYMAPEQARGEVPDGRADLFSLGVVLYRLCTAQLPFPGSNPMEVFTALASRVPPPPHTVNAAIPPALSALVMQLLEKDAGKRPASAREVVARFQQIEAAPPQPPAPPGPTPPPGPRHRRARGVAAVGTLLALGALMLGLAATVLRVETPEGTLVVQIRDPDVVVSVHDNGKAVVHEQSTKREFSLRVEKGEIHVFDKDGQQLLVTKKFQLRRGDRTTLDVTTEELRAARARLAEVLPWEPQWKPLFNGKDLTGWKYHPDLPGDWTVEEGVLTGTGRKGWLFSERGDIGDFHLRVEARINAAGDSGVFFWTTFTLNHGNDPTEWHEAQINNGDRGTQTGSLDGQGQFFHVREAQARPGEWFVLELLAVGNRVCSKVNGKPTAQISYAKAKKGHLALQVHGPSTRVQFRTIEIKELISTPP
jgi:serine/threonine protein kinase